MKAEAAQVMDAPSKVQQNSNQERHYWAHPAALPSSGLRSVIHAGPALLLMATFTIC